MSERSNFFSSFATFISELSEKPVTFALAVALVLVWAISGPFFGYSETWQLVINTSTTIITFLMVFVLQNSQNRDGKALQAKLDELILTSQAQNKFIGIEKLDEDALRRLSKNLAEKADHIQTAATTKPQNATRSLSEGPCLIDEAATKRRGWTQAEGGRMQSLPTGCSEHTRRSAGCCAS